MRSGLILIFFLFFFFFTLLFSQFHSCLMLLWQPSQALYLHKKGFCFDVKKMQSMSLSFLPAAAVQGHLCDSDRLTCPDPRSYHCLTFIVFPDVCQKKRLKCLADIADAPNKSPRQSFVVSTGCIVELSFSPTLTLPFCESHYLCGYL